MTALNTEIENATRMTLNTDTEKWWLWTPKLRSDDGSEHRNWECDSDDSESQNWKCDEDDSEHQNKKNAMMMALNAETENKTLNVKTESMALNAKVKKRLCMPCRNKTRLWTPKRR